MARSEDPPTSPLPAELETLEAQKQFAQQTMAAWLQRKELHGCGFVKYVLLGQEALVLPLAIFRPVGLELVQSITSLFEEAQEAEQLGLVILPLVTSAHQVEELLGLLNPRDEYQLISRESGSVVEYDLRWLAGGVPASFIGFGPLNGMPVTRRAPFTAMGLWSAGHLNDLRKRKFEPIGIGDMRVPDKVRPQYKDELRATQQRTREARTLLGHAGAPSQDPPVTFRLSTIQAQRAEQY